MGDDRKAEGGGRVVKKHPQEGEAHEEQSDVRHPPHHRVVAGVPLRLYGVAGAGGGALVAGGRVLHCLSTMSNETKTKRKRNQK